MKKTTLILLLLLTSLTFAFGQSRSDTIKMIKVMGSYQFFEGDQRLSINRLVRIMEPNELAYRQIKSAQSTYTFVTLLNIAGGFMVGWPLGTAVGGGDPNWAMAGVGAGLLVVSIPLNRSFTKKARLAVDTYNGGLQSSSVLNKSNLYLSVSDYGIGLRLCF